MKKKAAVISIAFATILVSAFTGKGTDAKDGSFTADPAASQVGWTGKKVTGQHNGYVPVKSGSFTFSKGNLTAANFEIDMLNLTCEDIKDEGTNKKLVVHLKSDDFFSVEKFPVATFSLKSSSKDGDKLMVTGDFLIKGKTSTITFPVTVASEGETVRVKGELVFDRSKHDVQFRSKSFFDPAALGDKLIYDEVNLTFDIVAKAK